MYPRIQSTWLRVGCCLLSLAALLVLAPASGAQGLASSDLSRFRFVGDAVLSPDGHRIAYPVISYDRPGRPAPQLWVMDLVTQKSIRIGGEKDVTANPRWSPDGKWLAFQGKVGDKHGLLLARPDGSDVTTLVEKMQGTQQPLAGRRPRRYMVARRQTDRIHFLDARRKSRRSQRRSDGHHALLVQARRWRRHDALQRQSTAAYFCRGCGHEAGPATDAGNLR